VVVLVKFKAIVPNFWKNARNVNKQPLFYDVGTWLAVRTALPTEALGRSSPAVAHRLGLTNQKIYDKIKHY
jgi:hypothetical protein